MMNIILEEDVPNLGVVGDLVRVKDGYARNYLIPQRKAVFASQRSVRELEHQKRVAAHQRKVKTAAAEGHKAAIEKLAVCMQAKVAPAPLGEDGQPIAENLQKLFGSITNRDIAAFLSEAGIKVEHRKIALSAPVRTVGKFQAKIRLNGGITADLPFWVVPEGAADLDAEKKRVEAAQATAAKELAARKQAEQAQRELEAKKIEEAIAAEKARAEAGIDAEPEAEEE